MWPPSLEWRISLGLSFHTCHMCRLPATIFIFFPSYDAGLPSSFSAALLGPPSLYISGVFFCSGRGGRQV